MKNILLSLMMFLLIACYPFLLLDGGIMRGYDGKPTGLKDMLDINGYYNIARILTLSDKNGGYYKPDTTRVIFYEDGIVLYGFPTISYDSIGRGGQHTIPGYFREIAANPKGRDAKSFYPAIGWGRYKISNDTIKASVVMGNTLNSAGVSEYWFKIIDRYTIETLRSDPKHKQSVVGNIGEFIPLDIIPSSDYCWLKKKK